MATGGFGCWKLDPDQTTAGTRPGSLPDSCQSSALQRVRPDSRPARQTQQLLWLHGDQQHFRELPDNLPPFSSVPLAINDEIVFPALRVRSHSDTRTLQMSLLKTEPPLNPPIGPPTRDPFPVSQYLSSSVPRTYPPPPFPASTLRNLPRPSGGTNPPPPSPNLTLRNLPRPGGDRTASQLIRRQLAWDWYIHESEAFISIVRDFSTWRILRPHLRKTPLLQAAAKRMWHEGGRKTYEQCFYHWYRCIEPYLAEQHLENPTSRFRE